MITYREGDIFTSNADILVNPVNCRGVMGGGLALEFKKRYPKMYKWHLIALIFGALRIGEPWLWVNSDGPDVLCFPTKDHWKDPSRLEYIEDGLKGIRYAFQSCPTTKRVIAFPKLGCGLGGLDWKDVEPLMLWNLTGLHIASKGRIKVEIWI